MRITFGIIISSDWISAFDYKPLLLHVGACLCISDVLRRYDSRVLIGSAYSRMDSVKKITVLMVKAIHSPVQHRSYYVFHSTSFTQ